MIVDLTFLPSDLRPGHLDGRSVVVFDVLRASTSIIAALAAGVAEIRIFADIESARREAADFRGPRLLCGEQNCLPPAGFDLGNSPRAFNEAHAGRTLFMATTNGTKAIVAARSAKHVVVGALVNAAAAAARLHEIGLDATFLCAGTQGQIAMEDVLGAGAVIAELQRLGELQISSDTGRIALRLFAACRHDLREALAGSQGGQNVIRAGLEGDINFAARLNSINAVGEVREGPLRVVRPWGVRCNVPSLR
jgi:2-phosphosulfolactate phosphatase